MEQCVELVVFEVKKNELTAFKQIHKQILTRLSQLAGFVRAESKKNILKDEFIDLIYWENRDFALKASEDFNSFPETNSFKKTISKVRVSEHYL